MLIAAFFTSLALASDLLTELAETKKLWNTLQNVLGGEETDRYVELFTKNWYNNPELFDSEPLSDLDLHYIGLTDTEIRQWRKTYPYPNLIDLPVSSILAVADFVPGKDYRNLINAMATVNMDKALLANVWNYAPLFRSLFTHKEFAFQFYSPNAGGNFKGYKEGPLTLLSGRTLHSITFKLLDAKISENINSCFLFGHSQRINTDQYIDYIYDFDVEYVKDENKFRLTICDTNSRKVNLMLGPSLWDVCTKKYFSKDAEFELTQKTLKIIDGKENQEILNLTVFSNNIGREQGFKFFNQAPVWKLLSKQTVEEKRAYDINEQLKKLTPTLPKVAKNIILLSYLL